jgi:hypothetical protein
MAKIHQTPKEMISQAAKESILEIQVNAVLAGHDLGEFEPVDTFTGGISGQVQALALLCYFKPSLRTLEVLSWLYGSGR